MAYEVLSDDLYESDSKPSPKRKRTHENTSRESGSSSFNPIYLHIAVIVIIILGLFFYFSEDFNFNFKDEPKKTTLGVIGNLDNFSYKFEAENFNLHSSEFILEAQDGVFSDKGMDFKISNFSGVLYLENKTLIVEGVAQRLEYDRNVFQLKGKPFKLVSSKKTTTDIYFDTISLNFTTGRIKLDENLNYDFTNSSIVLKKFNTSMSYDGTFSFTGHLDEFAFSSPNQHLNILYKE